MCVRSKYLSHSFFIHDVEVRLFASIFKSRGEGEGVCFLYSLLAQARGRGRRADATPSAGAVRYGGRKTHATGTADETTDEATTTKRKGTETQARRRGAAAETAKPEEGEGERRDAPGYVPTPEDLRLREV